MQTSRVALVCLVGLAGLPAVHAQTLRIGIDPSNPPFSKLGPGNQITGFDAEIADALCRQMARKCKVVAQDWDAAIPDLNAHKIDALVSSMAITEERMRLVTFTRPYYNTPARLVVRRGTRTEVDPPEKLKGLTLGVEAGTVYETLARGVYEPAGVKIMAFSGGVDQVWNALITRKVDATVNDVVVNTDFLKSAKGKPFIEVGPPITNPRYLGAGAAIAVAKDNSVLAARLDEALLAIYKNGEYAKIRARYFNFDIWAK